MWRRMLWCGSSARLAGGNACPTAYLTFLREREGYYGVAHFAFHFAVAASADYDVLLALPFVGHGRGLRAGRQLHGPQLLAAIGIERAQVRIERGRGEDQAACGGDGSAKIDVSRPAIPH